MIKQINKFKYNTTGVMRITKRYISTTNNNKIDKCKLDICKIFNMCLRNNCVYTH